MSAKKSGRRKTPKSAQPLSVRQFESGLEDDDKVRLPPVLGIRPGVYLAGIYGVVILAVLFFLLLWPGITRPGSVLLASSEPAGAALRVDGVYQEAAPCEVFVSAGLHRVEMVLPGFGPWSAEVEVPNRLFASRFFPLKTRIKGELKSADPEAAFKEAAAEFAAWTFAGEPSAVNQIPLVLSEAAYRLGPQATGTVKTGMEEILAASLRYGVTRAALRDLLRAKFLVDSRGLSPSPLGLAGTAADILALLEKNPASSAWLANLLRGDAADAIAESPWYAEETSAGMAAAALRLADAREPPLPGNTVLIEEIRFVEFPQGALVQSSLFPHTVNVESFMIAESEISRPLWEKFLAEKPEWRPENAEALVEKKLASADYLKEVELPGAPSPSGGASPVTSLSWHAAAAFCQWYSSRLPPAYSGWEARLPSEAEWEYAAKALPGMTGNHWEWCADDYAPLDFFPVNEKYAPPSPERAVRGGSWFNQAGSVSAGTRASLPPETCSAFVSFRPVLSQKRNTP